MAGADVRRGRRSRQRQTACGILLAAVLLGVFVPLLGAAAAAFAALLDGALSWGVPVDRPSSSC